MKSFVMTGTQDGLKSIPLSRLTPDQLRWGGADAEGFGTDIVTLYKAIPWLNRGVKARCNALVSMPYALHSGIGEDGAEVEETVLPAGMEIDLHDLIYTFAFHHILFGAAYGAKHSNLYRMDKPFRIFLPRTIKPEYDSAKGLTGFKRVVNGEAIEYTTDEMVWLWAKNPDSEVGPGPSDAQVALNAAGVLYFMDGYGNRFFAGGANNNTLVLLPDATTDAERERVQGWINRSVTGVRNAFKMIAVAMKEVKTVSLGTTPKELVIPELTTSKREDIATALGVPQTLLFSNAANYACLPGDQLVYTPDGAIPIANLSAGDAIYQYDDTGIVTNEVVAITPQGIAPVFEVRTQNRRIEASDNHKFLVLKVNKGTGNGRGATVKQSHEFIWKRTDELTTDDILVTVEELPDQCSDEFNGIKLTEELMEIAGLYVGDGDIAQGRTIRFAIPEFQAQQIYGEKAERVFSRAYKGYGELKAKYSKYIFTINSADAVRTLLSLGFGQGSRGKTIPAWLFTAKKPLQLAFLRGYLDSDGTVDKVRGQICYASANADLIASVRVLCISCGIPVSNLMHDVGRIGNFGAIEVHRFTCGFSHYNRLIGSNDPQRAERLQLNTNGTRDGRYRPGVTYKVRSLKSLPDGVGLSRITEVNYIGEKEVFDLSTEGSHTFIAEGIVVHNTARQDDIHFYDKTVKPDAYMIAKALNKKLFNPMGYTLVFHPERMEIYQQLESNKAVGVVTLYRGGIMGRAEGREYMGLAPDIPADVLDVSGMGTGQDQNTTGATLPELSATKAANNATIFASSAVEHAKACTCAACNPVDSDDEFSEELKRWKAMASKRFKEGKADKAREFKSDVLPGSLMAAIKGALESLTDAAQLGNIFESALEWQGYP